MSKSQTLRPRLSRPCRHNYFAGTWLWISGRMCFTKSKWSFFFSSFWITSLFIKLWSQSSCFDATGFVSMYYAPLRSVIVLWDFQSKQHHGHTLKTSEKLHGTLLNNPWIAIKILSIQSWDIFETPLNLHWYNLETPITFLNSFQTLLKGLQDRLKCL